MGYLINFLLETQDVMNFDKTVALIIKNKVHVELINELFEQTDQAMKRNKE